MKVQYSPCGCPWHDLMIDPYVIFSIADQSVAIVKKISKPVTTLLSNVVWDLSYPAFAPIDAKNIFNLSAIFKS